MLKRHRRVTRDDAIPTDPEPTAERRPSAAVAVDPERTEDVAAWLLVAGPARSGSRR